MSFRPHRQVCLVALLLLASCAGTQTSSDIPLMDVPTSSTVVIPNAVAGDAQARGAAPRSAQPQTPLTPAQARSLATRRLGEAQALWDRAVSYEQRNPAAAAELFANVVDDYPEFERAAESLFREGRAHFKARQYDDATQALKTYMRVAPVNPNLREVEELLYESGTKGIDSNTGLLSIFRTDEDALDSLKYVAEAFPAGEYADDSLMRLADWYFQDEDYATAALHYTELLLRYPDSEWSFKAYLRLGDTYLARDQGTPYNAGFLAVDPREPLPAEQVKMTAPIDQAVAMALEQFETYLERMEADPARAREYACDVTYARKKRDQCRELLACKDYSRGQWYSGRGCPVAAETYYREAAYWTGTRSGDAAKRQLEAYAARKRNAPTPQRAVRPPARMPTTSPTPGRVVRSTPTTVRRGPPPPAAVPTQPAAVPPPPTRATPPIRVRTVPVPAVPSPPASTPGALPAPVVRSVSP